MTLNDLKQNSYVPYSHRPQVAVAESTTGAYFPGVRIENISFPLTISAVQNALFCCLSEGEKPKTIYFEPSTKRQEINFWAALHDADIAELDSLANFKPAKVLFSVGDIRSRLTALLDQAVVAESEFPVAAILTTGAGAVSGVNIETPDWSRGLCAERVALAKAITYGCTNFKTLSIHTRGGEYSSPCGACRQVIIEHLPHHPVHLYHADGSRSAHFSSDLLPYSFQSSSLKKQSRDQ